MLFKKIIKYFLIPLGFVFISSCTDLNETVYSSVMSRNYYNTRMDIIRAVFRPFEHCYSTVYIRFETEELPADQIITPTRDTWWYDAGKWERYHYHTWTIDEDSWIPQEWNMMYIGIGQCNLVLDDLKKLNPEEYEMASSDFDSFNAQLRTMRAYCYIRLLNAYRNIVLTTTSDESVNSKPENRKQVPPKKAFEFIESELLWAIDNLPSKQGDKGNGLMQGQFTKAAAAGFLVRLYLNAEKWIGESHWDECAKMCERIINNEFGYYKIDNKWDTPFDWNNENSNEVIFAFPGTYGGTRWHYRTDYRTIYWRCNAYGAEKYYGVSKEGVMNPKFACSPSYDLDGNLYNHKLGMVTQKFNKYPQDVRLKKYKNLGNSTREGMFLYGYMPYTESGVTKNAVSPTGYTTYIRDQVGRFRYNAFAGIPENKTSTLAMGDHNSGWHPVKYPFYPSGEAGCLESDFVELRLAEIYYSWAECKLRNGDVNGAGSLMNEVRKRNYPTATHATYLYAPDGTASLDLDELLDEWGREFLVEGRRRTDLIRFGKFCSEAWWDKQPDQSNHWEIYPISRNALNANKYLVQNEGYEDVR